MAATALVLYCCGAQPPAETASRRVGTGRFSRKGARVRSSRMPSTSQACGGEGNVGACRGVLTVRVSATVPDVVRVPVCNGLGGTDDALQAAQFRAAGFCRCAGVWGFRHGRWQFLSDGNMRPRMDCRTALVTSAVIQSVQICRPPKVSRRERLGALARPEPWQRNGGIRTFAWTRWCGICGFGVTRLRESVSGG